MYAIVLYADFSGGIDIIRGAAELLASTCRELPPTILCRKHCGLLAALAHHRWRVVPHLFAVPAGGEPRWNRLAKVGKRLFGAKGRAMPGAAASVVVFLLIGVWHGSIGTRCCTACGSDC